MSQPYDLGTAECEELLRAGVVGRVAACTPAGPHIVPVNYAVVDDAFVLRTTPYSILGSQPSGSVLTLEVDRFDYAHQRGWSVVARGRVAFVDSADELRHIRETWNPSTWAAGARSLYLRVRWTELTGRRLGTGWDLLTGGGEQEEERELLALLSDRERLAVELHDTVIQRLFAVGTQLQAVALLEGEAVAGRLAPTIAAVDDTIRDIRTTIFDLRRPVAEGTLGRPPA